jgi:small subunit ribosomal protein S8
VILVSAEFVLENSHQKVTFQEFENHHGNYQYLNSIFPPKADQLHADNYQIHIMYTDPISDMLTRIRNASAARKSEVLIPFSKLKFEIAKILKHEDYIAHLEQTEESKFPMIKVTLKYDGKKSSIGHIQRVSTPGQRVYASKDQIPTVLENLGIAIISTPKGVMTNKQAKREGIGGEVICEVW